MDISPFGPCLTAIQWTMVEHSAAQGLSLYFHLESVKTSAVGRSLEGNDSYLTLDADLTLKVFENIPLCLMLDNNGDSSEVFDSFRTSS